MPASALGLALAAAFLHALWNLGLAREQDTEAATAIGLLTVVAVLALPAALTWRVEGAAVPYIAGSAALELAYFALLAAAYRRYELSLVYPVARGLAPVLALALVVAAGGAPPSGLGIAGIVAVTGGVLLIRGARGSLAGLAFGAVIAATIAGYTVLDRHGIAHAAALPYLLLLNWPASIVYCAWIARSRGRGLLSELRPMTVVIGAGMMGAYGLVLAALQRGSAAGVAATRETSILIATAYGAFVLGERVTRSRVLGALAIVAGVAAVALG